VAAAHTVATTVPAAAPTVPAARLGLLQQLGRLVSLLKYSLVFSAAIVVLPLSGIEGVALHSMTGSLFVELSPGGVFWASLFLLAAAWSVMLTTGLIVNGVTQRWSSTAGGYRRFESLKAAPSGQIPDWAELLFSVPVTPPQLVYYAALAVPGLVVVVRYAVRYEVDRVAAALGAAGAGLVTAYIVMLGLCTPAALLDPTDPPMRDPVALRVWGVLTQLTRLTTAMRWLQRQLSALAAWLRLHYLLDPATRLLYPAHFFAITVAVLLVVLWLAFAFLFRPEDGLLRAAPVVHLRVSLMLFVWVFGGLEFHLARLRVSPLLAVIVVVLLGYNVFSIDHTYHVRREGSASGLSPVAVVEGGGANLVVIASAGGGISAAVWTTLGLERLIQERPDLRREIRLLSTISGGSVGGAFFLDGLLRPPPASSLDTIRKKSGASSLDAVAYGLAYRDVPSLLTGGLSTLAPGRDRGELLERAWTRTAEGSTRGAMVRRGAHKDPPTLASLQSRIRSGEIPGFIFGATVMESGRRVMVTPIDFTEVTIPVPGPAAPGSPTGQALLARPKPRAATLSEYLEDPGLDMSLDRRAAVGDLLVRQSSRAIDPGRPGQGNPEDARDRAPAAVAPPHRRRVLRQLRRHVGPRLAHAGHDRQGREAPRLHPRRDHRAAGLSPREARVRAAGARIGGGAAGARHRPRRDPRGRRGRTRRHRRRSIHRRVEQVVRRPGVAGVCRELRVRAGRGPAEPTPILAAQLRSNAAPGECLAPSGIAEPRGLRHARVGVRAAHALPHERLPRPRLTRCSSSSARSIATRSGWRRGR